MAGKIGANVFRIDQTSAESEEIPVKDLYNKESSTEASQVDSATVIQPSDLDIEGRNTESKIEQPSTEVSEDNDVKKKKIARIASVSALSVFVLILAGSFLFEGSGETISSWQNVFIDKISLFRAEESQKDQMFDTAMSAATNTVKLVSSINETAVLRGLEEVALAGNLTNQQQLNLVLDTLEMDRILMGGSSLTNVEIESAAKVAASRLNIDQLTTDNVITSRISANSMIDSVINNLAEFEDKSEAEKLKAVVNSLGEGKIDLNEGEVKAIALQSAMRMGVEHSVAVEVAELVTAENTAYMTAIDTVKAAQISDDEKLYQVVNSVREAHTEQRAKQLSSVSATRISAKDLSLPEEQAQAIIVNAAKELATDPKALAIVNAKVNAEYKAENGGLSRSEQIFAGVSASALVEAKQNGLGNFETAMYVVEKAGSNKALEVVSKETGMNSAELALVNAQLGARDYLKRDINNPTDQEAVAYVASTVVSAAQKFNLSTAEQSNMVKRAIDIEAKRLDLGTLDVEIEKERALASIKARSAGLSELEVIAASESAAVVAKHRHNNLTNSQLKVMADQAVQNVIQAAGLDAQAEQEMIKRTLALTNISTDTVAAVVTAEDEIINKARSEADVNALSTIDREAYVAKATAEYRAKNAGMSETETEIAVIQAQAAARAKAMGLSYQRQLDIGQRAATVRMNALGLSEVEQTMILNKTERMKGPEVQIGNIPESPGTTNYQNLSDSDLRQNIQMLEKQVASLSVQMAEFANLANQVNFQNTQMSASIRQLSTSIGDNTRQIAEVKKQAAADKKARIAMASTTGVDNPVESTSLSYMPVQTAINSRFGEIPATSFQASVQSVERPSPRMYADIPETVNNREVDERFASSGACRNQSADYKYTVISDNYALITDQTGATQRVVNDSFVPGLGAVLEFQVKTNPRFVVFEHGIVCRME